MTWLAPRPRLSFLLTFVGVWLLGGDGKNLQAQEWPQFLGPNRNGTCTTATSLAENWPKEGPPVRWQRPVGAGFSGPIISRGNLFLFHQVGEEEVLECVETKTGRALWKSKYPARFQDGYGVGRGPRATPVIRGANVFTMGAAGMLHCWNATNGAQRWSVDGQKVFQATEGFFGMASSPLLEGNLLIVNVGGRPGAGIVAFDAENGRVVWKGTEDEASYASPVVGDLAGERCLLVLTRSALTGLSPTNGAVIFRYPWRPAMHASVSAATPLLIGDQVFLSACYGADATLLSLKDKKPQPLWSNADALSNHYATSVQHRGFLYGFHGRQEEGCELRCIELKSGAVRWTEAGLKAGTVTLVNDELFVLTERGELLRAKAAPAAFQVTARAQILPFVVRAQPALADGLFYARSTDKLVCIDLNKAN